MRVALECFLPGRHLPVPAVLTECEIQLRVTIVGDIQVTDRVRALANKKRYSYLLQNTSDYWTASDCVVASAAAPVSGVTLIQMLEIAEK